MVHPDLWPAGAVRTPATGLVVNGLIKRYEGFQLGPITLDLPPGVVVGLLGPNGAGKTTLLGCLGGQTRATAGTVRWDDHHVSRDSWALRERFGIVREIPALYEELTPYRLLRFAERIYERWDAAFAAAWADRLHVPMRKQIGTLSKGMRVKVGLLIALAHRAELFLLDEATSGLDVESRAELQDLVRSLAAEHGHLVVLSSHVLEDVELAATHVLILREGQITLNCPLSQLDDSLRDVYLGHHASVP